MLECTKKIYENLFKKHEQKTATEIQGFLSHTNIPKFSEDKAKLCDEDLTIKDLYGCLKSCKTINLQVMMGEQKNFMRLFGLN